jgi:hypothetical protein
VVKLRLYLSLGLRFDSVTPGTPVCDLCHIGRGDKGTWKLEIERQAANYLKRSLIRREESRTHGIRFGPECQVGTKIHVNPASRRAGKGIVAP